MKAGVMAAQHEAEPHPAPTENQRTEISAACAFWEADNDCHAGEHTRGGEKIFKSWVHGNE